MYLWKVRKKSNEEIYESNIRSDFSSTVKYPFAILLENRYCFLL